MKLLSKALLALAACIATAGTAAPAVAAGLAGDPFIRQHSARENFEPGGKFHLFNSRGTATERTGSISVTPVYRQRLGSFETEYALVRGDIGYKVRFSNHRHHEHAPFSNSSSRSASASKGNVGINLSSYNLQWSGTETHPADGYDGEQGSGYPAPTGARDEYAYKIKGSAASMNINLNDGRSPWERLLGRFAPVKHIPATVKNAWEGATTSNPNLNRAGNAAQAVNAAAAGVGGVAGAAGTVLGVGDAAQGLGVLAAAGAMEAVRALPPAAQIEAVKGISAAGGAAGRAADAYGGWAARNPNAAEGVRAVVNAATVGYGAAKGVGAAKAGKAAVSDNFADAYQTSGGTANAATYSKLKQQLYNQNLKNIASQDSRLAAAVKGSGTNNPNFSIGTGTRSEANRLGRIWVGDGAITTSGGGLLSADKTMQYRPPTNKKSQFSTTGVQANFEMYSINPVTGKRTLMSNGHLNITE